MEKQTSERGLSLSRKKVELAMDCGMYLNPWKLDSLASDIWSYTNLEVDPWDATVPRGVESWAAYRFSCLHPN